MKKLFLLIIIFFSLAFFSLIDFKLILSGLCNSREKKEVHDSSRLSKDLKAKNPDSKEISKLKPNEERYYLRHLRALEAEINKLPVEHQLAILRNFEAKARANSHNFKLFGHIEASQRYLEKLIPKD